MKERKTYVLAPDSFKGSLTAKEVCEAMERMNVRSDDTLVLRELLELGPMYIDPALKVNWEPRSNLKNFLLRFFERGPGFVEYHVFKRPVQNKPSIGAGWLWGSLHPHISLKFSPELPLDCINPRCGAACVTVF